MWCSMLLFRVILVKSCICSLFCPVFDNPMNVLLDYQRYCGCIVGIVGVLSFFQQGSLEHK